MYTIRRCSSENKAVLSWIYAHSGLRQNHKGSLSEKATDNPQTLLKFRRSSERTFQTLDVDIFTDTWIDSWALQTLKLRIENSMSEVRRGDVQCHSPFILHVQP